MSPRSNGKTALDQRSTLIKHVTSTTCKLEPAIWSRDTGQRITWFDRCQLCHNMMSLIHKVHGKPRLHVSATYYLEHGRCRRRRAHPRAIPLAMITMTKSIQGFPLLSMGMGLRYKQLLLNSQSYEETELRKADRTVGVNCNLFWEKTLQFKRPR